MRVCFVGDKKFKSDFLDFGDLLYLGLFQFVEICGEEI